MRVPTDVYQIAILGHTAKLKFNNFIFFDQEFIYYFILGFCELLLQESLIYHKLVCFFLL